MAHGNGRRASGNVGIGTTKPENADGWNKVVDILGSGHAKLSVRTAKIDSRVMAHDSGGFGAPAGMLVGTKSNHSLSFVTNAATRLHVSAAGNVGIGMVNPPWKLSVSSPKEHLALCREATETVGGAHVFVEIAQLDSSPVRVPEVFPSVRFHHLNRFWHRIEAQGNGFHLKDGNPASNAYSDLRARNISATGRLEVAGGGGTNVDLVVNGRLRSNNNDGGLWVAENRFVGGHSTSQIGFWNGDWRLTVLPNGNIGIGTTNSGSDRLRVEGGSTYLRGDVFVEGRLVYWWGPDRAWKHVQNRANDYAGSYSTSGPSDGRLKTAIRPIRNALGKISRLAGINYRWNEAGLEYLTRDVAASFSAGPGATDKENQELCEKERAKAVNALSGEHLGLVAQDIESVVPEAVHEDSNGYKHIHYIQLTALLIEAVKEQQAAIEQLRARLATLGSATA